MSFDITKIVVAALGGIMAFLAVIWAIPFIAGWSMWSASTSTGLTSTATAYGEAMPIIGILLGVIAFAGVLLKS